MKITCLLQKRQVKEIVYRDKFTPKTHLIINRFYQSIEFINFLVLRSLHFLSSEKIRSYVSIEKKKSNVDNSFHIFQRKFSILPFSINNFN